MVGNAFYKRETTLTEPNLEASPPGPTCYLGTFGGRHGWERQTLIETSLLPWARSKNSN